MMVWEIKALRVKSDLLSQFNKGVKVQSAVLMLLLGDDVLNDVMLLLQVLQTCLRGDIALGVG